MITFYKYFTMNNIILHTYKICIMNSCNEIVRTFTFPSTQRHTDGEPNFPPIAQEQCLKIIRHLQSLKYEDVPDYQLIDEAFGRTTNDVRIVFKYLIFKNH